MEENAGLIIGIEPKGKSSGKPSKAEATPAAEGSGELDMGAAKTDAAGALVDALGLDREKLDMAAVTSALEEFLACCGGDD